MNNQRQQAMSGRQRSYAAGLALAGLLFSMAAGLGGADALCLTQGCTLYKDVAFFGISLWWFGAAGFALIGGLCLVNKAGWAYMLAFAAVALDCVFLAWMALSIPCLNCLIAALLFFALFVCLALGLGAARLPALTVAILWLTLFSPNVFATGQEIAGPWRIGGQENAPVRVFFSPSCPSCRTALKGLLMGGEQHLAFYPVAEDEDDVKRLAQLRENLQQGASFVRAFAGSRDPRNAPELDLWQELSLRSGLFRNRMALARMGADRIPVITMFGVPQGFGSSGLGLGTGGLNFSGKDGFSGCTNLGDGTEDCD